MKYILYGVAVLILIYMSRRYIHGYILSIKEKRQKKIEQKEKEIDDVVFVPIEYKRTFVFALEVEEKGSGKAKLTVVKIPE